MGGFTIPMQMKLQKCIISYIRYCLFYQLLTDHKLSIIDKGENVTMNLNKKLQIKKSRDDIMDYFMMNDQDNDEKERKTEDNDNENDKIYFYLKYLSPIWKKEVVECHKIRRDK